VSWMSVLKTCGIRPVFESCIAFQKAAPAQQKRGRVAEAGPRTGGCVTQRARNERVTWAIQGAFSSSRRTGPASGVPVAPGRYMLTRLFLLMGCDTWSSLVGRVAQLHNSTH